MHFSKDIKNEKGDLMAGCRLGKEDRNETMGNQETLQIKLSL